MHSNFLNRRSQRKQRIKILRDLCVLLFITCSLTAQAVIIDKIVAIVNESVITQSELDAIEKLDLRLSGLPRKDSVLQERIDHHLALQQLKTQPPVLLSVEEVESTLESFQIRHGGEEQLMNFLTSIGMNREDLIQEIRNQLSIRKFIRDRFRPFVNITIEDAEDYYEKVYKPAAEMLAKDVPPFAEVFGEIQNLMVESKVQDHIVEWLQNLRKQARINVKD
jgi:parvulin-like peptidyl-prolyl isomerase